MDAFVAHNSPLYNTNKLSALIIPLQVIKQHIKPVACTTLTIIAQLSDHPVGQSFNHSTPADCLSNSQKTVSNYLIYLLTNLI